MIAQAAWQTPIFRTYVQTLTIVFAAVAAVLSFFTFALKKNVRSIWITYRSWIVMTLIILAAIRGGRVPTIGLFVALSLLALREFRRITELRRDAWMTAAVYLSILAAGFAAILPDPHLQRPGWFGLFLALPAFAVAAFFLVSILRNRADGQLRAITLATFAFVFFAWMPLHVTFLAETPRSCGYFFFLLFAVSVNDVAAFTFGKLLGQSGKHSIRTGISPKKTLEGSIGALAVSMLLPWLMRFSLPDFGTSQLILAGLIVGIGGQLGDLAMSVVKRDLGVKDMGAMIPGHGGVADRLDSLIYAAPLYTQMVRFYYHYW
jgi:phosphatidate cytidylyltransferase